MIDKIKSEFKLNVKEANWLMNEQDYDAEELIDQNYWHENTYWHLLQTSNLMLLELIVP